MSKKALLIIAAIWFFGEMPVSVSAQWMFDPSGFFYMKGDPPKDCTDFGYIVLSKNTPGSADPASSYLVSSTGARFPFDRLNTAWTPASQGCPIFEFFTATADGVSYAFMGRFLDNRVFATNVTDPETVIAEGELTKFIGGKKTAGATVQLTYYARPWGANDDLMFSAKRSDLAAVKSLLGRGADAKAMGPYALSVLEYAVASGSKEIVKAILAAGADTNSELSWDQYNRHPLFIADEGRTALMHAAAGKNNLGIIELLLASGAAVNASDWRGSTALYYAAMFNSPDIVEALIRAGADVNASDKEGETVLMLMAGSRAVDKERLVGILLAAGADVAAVNKKGETALMKWSAAADATPIVNALIRAGADVNVHSRSNATALSVAEYYRKEDIVKILREAGAKK
jgi:ankyrin repeat protein